MSRPDDIAEPLPPRVLCIAGSPRRHGNSEQLLDALVSRRRGGGWTSRSGSWPPRRAPARAAAATRARRPGACIQRDGMDAVYAQLDAADAIVVATPVFFATVPAVLKIVFDRCQPYWARRYVLGEPPPAHKRPGAMLVVGGGGDPFGTTCAVTPVKSVFAVLGVSAETVFECVGPDAAERHRTPP